MFQKRAGAIAEGMFYPYVRRAAGLKVTEENVEINANRSHKSAFQTLMTSFTIE
ncbi:hypothetical protein [Paenibacillus dendritiformis]|uniref:hypothetical protein n=1 Tax=Paenibacillus dendritiformis TaxID=130049 RepID=UPI00140B4E81|nr:hypothetical protein [Paenibacillus dendritiformis]